MQGNHFCWILVFLKISDKSYMIKIDRTVHKDKLPAILCLRSQIISIHQVDILLITITAKIIFRIRCLNESYNSDFGCICRRQTLKNFIHWQQDLIHQQSEITDEGANCKFTKKR